jgi:hypothetical protein
MTAASGRALYALLLWGAHAQIPAFSFAGVSLGSNFQDIAARYPHSSPQSEYVSLAPEDVHDHISAIEVSGSGPTRRVRITFETRGAGGQAEYPRCATIEAQLSGRFGRPHAVRRFMEEASPRADRLWRSATEELTLLCFAERGQLWAEAVQITPR